MAANDELFELFDMARRALECQAELGHRELIFEKRDEPIFPKNSEPAKSSYIESENSSDIQQTSLLQDTPTGPGNPEFTSIENHRSAICDCSKCPLVQTRTNFVYGVGNPHADIMFIGEAPGRDEDLQGEPFVGRAGKLLDKILAAMKLSRQDVYIGNILKCRPPENRDPQPEEMSECMPYLLEQIRLIKPKIICALGRIAAQSLLETSTPLGKLRGRWHKFHGIPLIVTYHPAALLRFQQYKRPTWEDMQELLTKYGRINQD